jgi:hypothetical protein
MSSCFGDWWIGPFHLYIHVLFRFRLHSRKRLSPRAKNELTVSMASPSAAASFLSLALTAAVVDKMATATFDTASFWGGLVATGYANRLGLALETKSNLGALQNIYQGASKQV